MKLLTTVALLLNLTVAVTYGQSARPTIPAMAQTLMISTDKESGTAFALDVGGREYWITAKHVLKGLEHPPYGTFTEPSVSIWILKPHAEHSVKSTDAWFKETFDVIDTGNDVDIVVLVPRKIILGYKPLVLKTAPTFDVGGDCEFLGYPNGGGWRMKWLGDGQIYWFPYSKHCTISGRLDDGSDELKPYAWVLDGLNNKGFSGGPVVANTGDNQYVFAVISGYQTEPADIVPDTRKQAKSSAAPNKSKHADSTEKQTSAETSRQVAQVNSGFIIAYSIDIAIQAINGQQKLLGPIAAKQITATQ